MRRILILLAVLMIGQTAHAQQQPNPAAIPALDPVRRDAPGAKIYYMGRTNGLESWFIIVNNQVTNAYTTPDGQGLLLGALYAPDGRSVTGDQVIALRAQNADVDTLFKNATIPNSAVIGVKSATPSNPAVASDPLAPQSPGERLLVDLANANYVSVGSSTAPILYMIVDPYCPHCKKAWEKMRGPMVGSGKVQVRLLPIAAQKEDSARAGAMLLTAADPLTAWNKHVDGKEDALAGTPPNLALQAMANNVALVQRWKLPSTPYFVYRDLQGKVKVIDGPPDDYEVLISQIGTL